MEFLIEGWHGMRLDKVSADFQILCLGVYCASDRCIHRRHVRRGDRIRVFFNTIRFARHAYKKKQIYRQKAVS